MIIMMMMFTECDGEYYYGCAADDAIISNWKEAGKVKFSIKKLEIKQEKKMYPWKVNENIMREILSAVKF